MCCRAAQPSSSQARVWEPEPEAEALLGQIGVAPAWRCVDLSCGALGIFGRLTHRVGAAGRVTGVDLDPQQLAAARAFVCHEELGNVHVLERDAYATGLPGAPFDLVHVRVDTPVAHAQPRRIDGYLAGTNVLASTAVFWTLARHRQVVSRRIPSRSR
jgi:SAM-dependent methyltransferase